MVSMFEGENPFKKGFWGRLKQSVSNAWGLLPGAREQILNGERIKEDKSNMVAVLKDLIGGKNFQVGNLQYQIGDLISHGAMSGVFDLSPEGNISDYLRCIKVSLGALDESEMELMFPGIDKSKFEEDIFSLSIDDTGLIGSKKNRTLNDLGIAAQNIPGIDDVNLRIFCENVVHVNALQGNPGDISIPRIEPEIIFFKSGDKYYPAFVMEKIGVGINLLDRLGECMMKNTDNVGIEERQSNNLSWALCLIDRLKDISYTLDYLHSKGIIHRDIKPTNILESNDQDPEGNIDLRFLLGDFGLAKLGDDTLVGNASVGSFGHISPEVLMNLSPAAVGQSDQHALGIIFADIVGGKMSIRRYHFKKTQVEEIINAVLNEPTFYSLKENVQQNLGIDGDYAEAIEKVLEISGRKDPNERFRNCTIMNYLLFDLLNYSNSPDKAEFAKKFVDYSHRFFETGQRDESILMECESNGYFFELFGDEYSSEQKAELVLNMLEIRKAVK